MMSEPAAAPSSSSTESAEPSFESRLNTKLSGGGGSALPGDVASHASSTYGADMSQVRVHSDAEAGQMADAKGFQAFSYGADVFSKPGATDTSTQHGSFVMMHELAHVAQSGGQREAGVHGKAQFGSATDANDSLELDADKGAEAALSGGTHQVQSAPLMVRGFGATAQRDPQTGQRNRNDIVHENQTENAAERVGFSQRDQEMIYSGNWQRDMNQFLIPKMRAAGPVIFSAMDLLHTLHFGFPIAGSPETAGRPGAGPGAAGPAEFGTYDPVEHIDNPGGLTGGDVNQQRNAAGGDADSAGSSSNAGAGDQAYADADARYREQFARVTAAGHSIENPEETNEAFRVDDSGIPIYMQTSRHQLIQQLQRGLDLLAGSNWASRPANYDRALRHSGEALHVMQDYYAHSNFCEVAMNMLIDQNFNDQNQPAQTGGRSFVDTLHLSALNPTLADPAMQRGHLNSYVHRRTNGQADANRNMTTRGGREVMATGTFTLEDTAHSIKEKVGLALHGLNPFTPGGPAGPSEKTLRLITWLEGNPTYFPMDLASTGTWVGEKLQTIMPLVNGLARGGNAVLGVQGAVSAAADRTWGRAQGLWHRATGDADQAAQDVAGGDANAARHEADAARRQQVVTDLQTELHNTAAMLAGGGSLTALYTWTYKAGSHLKLSSLARMIPLVGEQAAEIVEKAVKEIKEWLRAKFETAWTHAMTQFTAEFNAAVQLSLGSSEVSDQTGAQTMTQPSHTDIAKDFDSHQQGSEDRFSIIEEVGEFVHRVGSARSATFRVLNMARDRFNQVVGGQTGVIDGLRSATQDIGQEIAGPAAEEGGHQHQHRHGGAWLAPLANTLATSSSEAILRVYRAGLEKARNGQAPTEERAGVATVTNQWFAHPADCTGIWQGQFMSVLGGDSVDATEIKRELARRIALPPSQQSSNDEATIGGEDRHGGHDHGDHDHGGDSAWRPGGGDHDEDHDHDHPH